MKQRPAILFSADELRPSRVDDTFLSQSIALIESGFRSWNLGPEHNRIISRGESVEGASLLFRGWMMKPDEYQRLDELVRSAGASLFVTPAAYVASHHISGWVDALGDLTPQTFLFPPDADIRRELQAIGWDSFFIKDFVKSLKTSRGSVASSPEDAVSLIDEMKRFRGTIEGGFAIRRVEQFRADTEMRFFVLEGEPWSPSDDVAVPAIVREAARRHTLSPFFSIDVIQRDDGALRVVEIGDGQVSDIVGWTPERFAQMLRSHWPLE